MCNAKPGLRCDAHAVRKVNAQQIKIADIRTKMRLALTPAEREELLGSLQRAEERLREDTLEYSLTPAGQQEMVEMIRQKQLLGENTDALYERLGKARALAHRRREASQRIEVTPSELEESMWVEQTDNFKLALSQEENRKKAAMLRKERQRWKSINAAARDTYTSLINNGKPIDEYEQTLVEKIRMSKYLLSKVDEMEDEILNASDPGVALVDLHY